MTKHPLAVFAALLATAGAVIGFDRVLFVLPSMHFDPDEFQHVHIAWNLHTGKALYRDFFDHHGPIFALINALLFDWFNLERAAASIDLFRTMNAVYVALLCAGIFLVSRAIHRSYPAGAAAVFLFLAFDRLIAKACEIRPDTLQSGLWLLGFYFLLRRLQSPKERYSLAAGALWGLSIAANFKAIVGPAAALGAVAALMTLRIIRVERAWKATFWCAAGALGAVLPFIVYFGAIGALRDLVYYNVAFNFIALSEVQSNKLWVAWDAFSRHRYIIPLSLLGLVLAACRAPSAAPLERAALLVTAITALLTLAGGGTGLYLQYYLIPVPLLIVIAASPAAIIPAFSAEGARFRTARRAAAAFFALLLFATLAQLIKWRRPPLNTAFRQAQLSMIQLVIDNTEADEPTFVTWGMCGGYVFNADLRYHWMSSENFQLLFMKEVGNAAWGEGLARQLAETRTKFLFSFEDHLREIVSEEAFAFISSRYEKFHECFWVSRDILTSELARDINAIQLNR